MSFKGRHHSAAAKGPNGSTARGTRFGLASRRALEAERDRLLAVLYSPAPADLVALRRLGITSESTAHALDVARSTILRLRRAVEGEPEPITGNPPRPLSPQRVVRLETAERLLGQGIALGWRALTADDREAASSSGTLLRAADSIITDTLGMDLEAEVPSLAAYLASERETPATAASATNGAGPEPEDARAAIIPEIEANRCKNEA